MGQVYVLSTGGTISMRREEGARGAIPTLTAEDFARQLPPGLPDIQIESYSNLPTSHMTLDFLFELAQHVSKIVEYPEMNGIVITQGTDIMEESAYLLHLLVNTDKPVVLTGSMRHASQVGYDGLSNLAAAIRVAADPAARGLGALVVMNEEIHAARWVTKTDTHALNAFRSPGWGPLGRVVGERVIIQQRVIRQHIPCPGLARDVPLIKLAAGLDDAFLRMAINRHAPGVVLETLGSGRVPPWWMPSLRRAARRGMIVVATSRCLSGQLGDEYGYVGAYRDVIEVGAIPAQGLSGPKARIKLLVALGATSDPQAIRRYFEEEA